MSALDTGRILLGGIPISGQQCLSSLWLCWDLSCASMLPVQSSFYAAEVVTEAVRWDMAKALAPQQEIVLKCVFDVCVVVAAEGATELFA